MPKGEMLKMDMDPDNSARPPTDEREDIAQDTHGSPQKAENRATLNYAPAPNAPGCEPPKASASEPAPPIASDASCPKVEGAVETEASPASASEPNCPLSIIHSPLSSSRHIREEDITADAVLWYVMRAAYGTELKSLDILQSRGYDAYVPMLYSMKVERSSQKPGKTVKRYKRRPVSNLLFVRASRKETDLFVHSGNDAHIRHLHYYYNHTQGKERGQESPICISDWEMRNFRLVADADDHHVQLVRLEDCHFKTDSNVVVTQGRFKGVEGRVARVGRQQRVVVGAGNFIIATSYVPTTFFEETTE